MALILFEEDTQPSHLEESVKWHNKPAALPRKSSPEAVKLPKEADQPRKDGIISLSYDQVNDNADELIELRGEGRYFGVTDPTTGDSIASLLSLGPICDNCHKRGHIRVKCKTVVCHKCGVVGDHYETHCPTTVVCVRCGERGHVAAACTSKSRKRQYCNSCDSFRHGNENCPGIWRSYLTIPENDGKLDLPLIYCYNCASSQHYGDECSEQRTSRIPNINGSAFSGINLPKYLRDLYFDFIEGRRSNKSNHLGKEPVLFGKPRKPQVKESFNGKKLQNSRNLKGINQNNHNNQSNHNNSTSRDFKKAKKNDHHNNWSSGLQNLQPSRSGFIVSKTQTKKLNGGMMHQLGQVMPNRSGVVSKKKKAKKENFQALY